MVHLPPLAYQNSATNTTTMVHSTENLPSLKVVCQEMMVQDNTNASSNLRHHYRARSLPTTLPSNPPPFAAKKRDEKSSMDVLLNAIALDEKMGSMYKQERVKNFVREQQWLYKTQKSTNFKPRHENDLVRRRSRSAPGAPLAHYHYHIALNTARWYLPNHDEDYGSYHSSHDIAHALVQQHLKSAAATFKK
ncbi:hypothetical protein BCR42DRAFT_421865 [Absidia repens]|uniref:Uncharacterized protein n=1 Tax=Absidia repens TaxID=90262 RepID=A0A1X2I744_9FUNG|nr:hypothetical protein BCR42DRAFT_421865 [Absidia repens]